VLGLFKQADAIAQLDTAPAPHIMKRSTKRNLSIRTKTTPTLTPAPLRPQHTVQGQGQYPTSLMGRSSPWGTPGAGEWRTAGGSFTPVVAGILTISLVHCPISTSTTTTSMSAMWDIKEVSLPTLPDSALRLPLVCGRATCRVPTLGRPANCSWTLDLTGVRRPLSPDQRQAARPHTFRRWDNNSRCIILALVP
jgi:hypothetical protein